MLYIIIINDVLFKSHEVILPSKQASLEDDKTKHINQICK